MASVPRTRRLVREALVAWGRPDVVHNAELCVTELAANATLHGSGRYFDVAMENLSDSVRITVEDKGPLTALEAPPPAVDGVTTPVAATDLIGAAVSGAASAVTDDEPTTGRGLLIVAAVASSWGVRRTAVGKSVWAELDASPELDADPAERPVGPEQLTGPTLTAAKVDTDGGLPADEGDQGAAARTPLPREWQPVCLVDVPAALAREMDRHLDEVIRELQLVEAEQHPATRELRELVVRLLDDAGHPLVGTHLVSPVAAADEPSLVTIELPVRRQSKDRIRLLEACEEADRLSEAGMLITLPASTEIRLLRRWIAEQILSQAEQGTDPVSFGDWRSQAVAVDRSSPAG